MENSAAIQASLAGRYASALFDLAAEQGTVTSVEGDLARVEQSLGESAELAAMIRHPRISRQMQAYAIDGVAGVLGLSQLTRNFVGVLAKNRRLGDLPDIIRAFRAIAAAQRGEMAAEVTSAHALSDGQLAELKDRLTAREGRTVTLSTKVDPELLGGLVVTIGSKRIDGSIRTRLNSLAHAMKG